MNKYALIEKENTILEPSSIPSKKDNTTFYVILIVFAGAGYYIVRLYQQKKLNAAFYFSGILLLGFSWGFKNKTIFSITSITNPLTVDSAFTPFKPNVVTNWDTTNFYVQSHGIPTTHNMMIGITAWQQQIGRAHV